MSTIEIRQMTSSDVALGMRLKSEANWNQLEEDWHRVVSLEPMGCFVGVCDGVDVGTVATTIFGGVAWISMMLVSQNFRSRGIGRSLMRQAIQYIETFNVATIRLDATPLGKPLYESLGFQSDWRLNRYMGTVIPDVTNEKETMVTILSGFDSRELRSKIVALDERVTRSARGRFLNALIDERPSGFRCAFADPRDSSVEITAYALERAGFHGTLIGPVMGDRSSSLQLARRALTENACRAVLMDVPEFQLEARSLVAAFGLTPHRELFRMTRGKRIDEDRDAILASSGPEKG